MFTPSHAEVQHGVPREQRPPAAPAPALAPDAPTIAAALAATMAAHGGVAPPDPGVPANAAQQAAGYAAEIDPVAEETTTEPTDDDLAHSVCLGGRMDRNLSKL